MNEELEKLKSGGKPVINTCSNTDIYSSGDYPESVPFESSAKQNLDLPKMN